MVNGRWIAVLCAAGVMSSAACDGESACPGVDEPAALELGGGSRTSGFVAVEDGAEMQLVLGPAGLYMLGPSLRAHGIHPGEAGRFGVEEDPLVEIEALLETTSIGGLGAHATGQEYMGMEATADGAVLMEVYVGMTGSLQDLEGKTITLRAEITDRCGHHATDELDVIAVESLAGASPPTGWSPHPPGVIASCH